MPLRRHRQPLKAMSEINVTNMIDTAFTLLITFMLVAPHLTHGINIDLPQVAAPNLAQDKSETLLVTIQKQDPAEPEERVYVGSPPERVTLEELNVRVGQALVANPKLSVVIEGDKAARYGMFFAVIDAVQRAGVQNVGLTSDLPLTAGQTPPSTEPAAETP